MTDTENKVPHVYQAINAVQAELAALGITKTRQNTQQGYKFRGIDDVYNTLAPILAKHKLLIIPNVLTREMLERISKKGDPLFNVVVYAKFTFISAEDGSSVEAATYGEAMDTADKATNKAMSAAYKYVCLQAFSIPTEGDNDADATTHEVAPRKKAPAAVQAKPAGQAPTLEQEQALLEDKKFINLAQTQEELAQAMNDIKAKRGAAFEQMRPQYTLAYSERKAKITGAAK